jgi:hypothetical protein
VCLIAMLVLAVTTDHWGESFTTAFCIAYALHFLTRIQLALLAVKRPHEDFTSGALELLLVTPIAEIDLIAAHHRALQAATRRPLGHLFAMNGLLQLTLICFHEQLHMDNGAWALFTVCFLGGIAITRSDVATLRWLALRQALTQPTPLRAAGRSLAWLVAFPWPAFGVAMLLALRISRINSIYSALPFLGWVLLCLAYNRFHIARCRAWLRPGLRHRFAQSHYAPSRAT